MIRALIAEDEPLARRTLRELAREIDWLAIVGEADEGRVAVRLINRLEPDLLFLDVQMPELTGLQVLEQVAHRPAVVFTTAFDRYAVTAFELEAIDYLVKPFGRKRFVATMERVRRHLDAGPAAHVGERLEEALRDGPVRRLFARKGTSIVPLQVDGIVRVEAGDNYLSVYTSEGRFLLSVSLSELEERLDPERFRRVHRAHIVNLDFVVSIEPFDDRRVTVTMRDGSRVVASRSGSQMLRGMVT
jgi:two-component system, LytTR family, response regulator